MAKQQNVTKPWDQDLMDQIQQRKMRALNEKRGLAPDTSPRDHRRSRRKALLELEEQKRRASETPEETEFRLRAAYIGTQNQPTDHESVVKRLELWTASPDYQSIVGKETIQNHKRRHQYSFYADGNIDDAYGEYIDSMERNFGGRDGGISALRPSRESNADQPPNRRPERQSYLGRDLETGHLVGRETFMGQPLTPKLERIPASMRGRVEQSQAIAAQSGKMGLTGPPTPERVAAVREAIAERIASAKTEEERKQVEQQQAKILDQIQTETINSAGMIVDMARRGDQLAAQFAPIIMEELGELREVEMQMARLDPSDETGMEEMREIRSEIIESIQSIVGTGAMPELIERTRNAPSEEDLVEQQQMQARVEQRMAQAQQRYVERQQQSQMSLTTDLQRIDEQTQQSIDRIDPMVPKIVDLEDGSKKQLTYQDQVNELQRQAVQRKIQAQTAHYRQQRINEEFADFDQVNVLQNELMTQRNPRVLRPWLEAMYGGADVIEQMGGYEVVLENTRDEIREYIGEQNRRSRSTGFVHTQAGALSIGDLDYLYGESDDVRIMVDKLGIQNPEDMAMMLRTLQLQESTNEDAQKLLDLIDSIPIPPVHDYDAVRQVYPPLRELMQ